MIPDPGKDSPRHEEWWQLAHRCATTTETWCDLELELDVLRLLDGTTGNGTGGAEGKRWSPSSRRWVARPRLSYAVDDVLRLIDEFYPDSYYSIGRQYAHMNNEIGGIGYGSAGATSALAALGAFCTFSARFDHRLR